MTVHNRSRTTSLILMSIWEPPAAQHVLISSSESLKPLKLWQKTREHPRPVHSTHKTHMHECGPAAKIILR